MFHVNVSKVFTDRRLLNLFQISRSEAVLHVCIEDTLCQDFITFLKQRIQCNPHFLIERSVFIHNCELRRR